MTNSRFNLFDQITKEMEREKQAEEESLRRQALDSQAKDATPMDLSGGPPPPQPSSSWKTIPAGSTAVSVSSA